LRQALRQVGIRIGDRRLQRLMRAAGVRAHGRRRFRPTTDSTHREALASNQLARAFTVRRLNRVWAGDITALWTTEGWLYLAVLLDLASRRVIGWAAEPTLETTLPLAALQQALARRPVRPGLLHHSDRGVQYASARYRDLLRQQGIGVSMSRRANCWDNSVVESFFSSLKTELHPATWPTRAAARTALTAYIEGFYNVHRLHSTLGYRSPADVEAQFEAAV
jgi:transposase InsO family protein